MKVLMSDVDVAVFNQLMFYKVSLNEPMMELYECDNRKMIVVLSYTVVEASQIQSLIPGIDDQEMTRSILR